MSEILPNLLLGGLADAKKAVRVETTSFLCLLPEAKEEGGIPALCRASEEGRRCLLLVDVRDEAHAADVMRAMLPACLDFIAARQNEGVACLVFCKWGQSRSATVVIAYMMSRLSYSLRSAFWWVRSVRHNAFPNVGFFKMLQEMDLDIFGRLSMDETPTEYLGINLNKQITPTSELQKFFARSWRKFSQRFNLEPDRRRCYPGLDRGLWQVAPDIYVSDAASANDAVVVKSSKIERILSLIPEQQTRPVWANETIRFLAVPLSDDPQRAKDTVQHWERCHAFIFNGGKTVRTLVFCEYGHGLSRSSAVVMSYLMIKQGFTLHHAFWSVRQRQHRCFPNPGLFEELKSMEMRLLDGLCSMPLSPEEYLKLKAVSYAHRPSGSVVTSGGFCCSRTLPASSTTGRLYGPLGINLEGKLSLGDLCLASGFAELPTCRCLLVAGHPKYYEDQSWELSLDVYRLKVLTPVPPDTVHQIRVAVRMVLLVIDPNTYRIFLADESDPRNESLWLALRIYCSPFRDKDIDKDLMLRIIRDVELAPCTQSGEASSSGTAERKGQVRIAETDGMDIHEHWLEMLESPVDAPVRIWHRYLWEQWINRRSEDEEHDSCLPDSGAKSFDQELREIMPLAESTTFSKLESFLVGNLSQWSQMDLRHVETRYTKHCGMRAATASPGSQLDLEHFKHGSADFLLDKCFNVSGLTLHFLSRLGRGKHAMAFRAFIQKSSKELPAWQEDSEVSVKVWQKDDATWAREVDAMQSLPPSVRHCDRFIDAGRLQPQESHATQLLHGLRRVTNLGEAAAENPLALVTTLASGLSLSKLLKSSASFRIGLGLKPVSSSFQTGEEDSQRAHPLTDRELWNLVRQVLEFSVALEEQGAYHGDMTLDNAFWDSERGSLTIIDFGNAGLTKDDPWLRTQKSGCLQLLAQIRERLEGTNLPLGPGSCMAWLATLKAGAVRLPSFVPKAWPLAVAPYTAAQQSPTVFASCEELRRHFQAYAPKRVARTPIMNVAKLPEDTDGGSSSVTSNEGDSDSEGPGRCRTKSSKSVFSAYGAV